VRLLVILVCFFLLISCRVSRSAGGTLVLPGDTLSALRLPYRIIQPENATKNALLVQLHCAGCDQFSWDYSLNRRWEHMVDSSGYTVAIATDNDLLSWWLDSPLDSTSQFTTYILDHFIPYMHKTYGPFAYTGIFGHSMGGFGSLHNALVGQNRKVIDAVCAIKPGIDLRFPFPENWGGNDFGLRRILGDDPNVWQALNLLERACDLTIPVKIITGTKDSWFYEENVAFHRQLQACGIAHQFVALEQNHFVIDATVVEETFTFFDSLFVD